MWHKPVNHIQFPFQLVRKTFQCCFESVDKGWFFQAGVFRNERVPGLFWIVATGLAFVVIIYTVRIYSILIARKVILYTSESVLESVIYCGQFIVVFDGLLILLIGIVFLDWI